MSQRDSQHIDPLQHTATHCNTLQHTATHCNTLQHTATAKGLTTVRSGTYMNRCIYNIYPCIYTYLNTCKGKEQVAVYVAVCVAEWQCMLHFVRHYDTQVPCVWVYMYVCVCVCVCLCIVFVWANVCVCLYVPSFLQTSLHNELYSNTLCMDSFAERDLQLVRHRVRLRHL